MDCPGGPCFLPKKKGNNTPKNCPWGTASTPVEWEVVVTTQAEITKLRAAKPTGWTDEDMLDATHYGFELNDPHEGT